MSIPKKIHLTCKDKNKINNSIWKKCLKKYRMLYPDYHIIIHDNQDIYQIIDEYYPEYLEKIKKINIGAVLADIFRYLILYLEGGIYSDFDCEPIKRIDDLLEKNISTILCYEFHSDFIPDIKNNKLLHKDHLATKIYGFQFCQYFMISEPKQNVFLKMFLSITSRLDELIQLNVDDTLYIKNVINITGPSGFTKIVVDNMTEKIKILPSDYFCSYSWNGAVPFTKNSYIKHKCTGSWLNKNEDNNFKMKVKVFWKKAKSIVNSIPINSLSYLSII